MKVRIIKKANSLFYPQKRFFGIWLYFFEGLSEICVSYPTQEQAESFLERERKALFLEEAQNAPPLVVKQFEI